MALYMKLFSPLVPNEVTIVRVGRGRRQYLPDSGWSRYAGAHRPRLVIVCLFNFTRDRVVSYMSIQTQNHDKIGPDTGSRYVPVDRGLSSRGEPWTG